MPGPIVWVKEHPYTSAAVVVGVVAVFWLYSSASSGSASQGGTVVTNQPSDAEVQAGTQLQLAQMQGQLAALGIQAQLQHDETITAGQITLAQLQAGVQTYGIQQQAVTQQQTTNAQQVVALQSLKSTDYANLLLEQSKLAEIGGQIEMSGIAADTQKALANYQYNMAVTQFQTARDVSLAQISSSVDIAALNAKTQQDIAAYSAATAQAQIQAGVEAANIVATAQTAIANYTAQTQLGIAKQQASVMKRSSDNSLIGGIVGAIASIF